MKVSKVSATNFGSYSSVEFDFSDTGLALVAGPTGAGKSTLMDLVPWILFGTTSKNGSVDDIRSWTNTNEPTKGTVNVDGITITRIRGSSKQNDLFWTEEGSEEKHRGKDLKDTQLRLEDRLAITADLYLTCAYFHGETPTGHFFTAKAKQRRELFEQLSNSPLLGRLLDAVPGHLSEAKSTLKSLNEDVRIYESRLEQVADSIDRMGSADAEYDVQLASRIELLSSQSIAFDKAQAEAKAFHEKEEHREASSGVCGTCGGPKRVPAVAQIPKAFKAQKNPYFEQIEALKIASSPYAKLIHDAQLNQANLLHKLDKVQQSSKDHLVHIASLTRLQDTVLNLRAQLLQNTVSRIQADTNRHLSQYFGSVFTVQYALSGTDSLEVAITKDGIPCVFRQLSKGQRQILRLSFSVAVMAAAANKVGTSVNCLMFDESLEGMDESTKVSAYGLFEELAKSHSSVLVIDHSTELQNQFSNKYTVSINGNESSIDHE